MTSSFTLLYECVNFLACLAYRWGRGNQGDHEGGAQAGVVHTWMEVEVSGDGWGRNTGVAMWGIPFAWHLITFLFNYSFCITGLHLKLIFVIVPICFISEPGLVKTGKCTEGGDSVARNIWFKEDWISSGRIGAEGLYGLLRGAISHSSTSFIPTPTQNVLPYPNCHHFQTTPSGAWRSCTWSYHSCNWRNWIGNRSSLLSCTTSFGDGYAYTYGTPLPIVGGIKRVYKCWV